MLRPIPRKVVLEHRRPFTLRRAFRGGAFSGFDFTDLDNSKRWNGQALIWKNVGAIVTTTPEAWVAASGDTVNMLLDRSQGFPGPELLVGGDMASLTPWPMVAAGSRAIVGGRLQVTGGSVTQGVPHLNGHRYWLRGLHGTSITNGQARLRAGTTAGGADYVSETYGIPESWFQDGYIAAASAVAQIGIGTVGTMVEFASASCFDYTGNNATQGTSSKRPTLTVSGGLSFLVPDKADDVLLTSVLPSARMTLIEVLRPGAAGALQVAMGAMTAAGNNDRVRLSIDAAGVVSGAWGGDGETVIKDASGTDRSGTDIVIALLADENGVELWCNGAVVYSGAANGSPATCTQPIYLCANNGNGTAGNFQGGRSYGKFLVNRRLSRAEIRPAMRAARDAAKLASAIPF